MELGTTNLRPTTYLFGLICGVVVLAGGALAEQATPKSPHGFSHGTTAPEALAAEPQVAMPDAENIVALIRTTLLTLNDALQTGNFTVLRDIGAPGFREPNSAARLSQIFSNLVSQAVDLSAIATVAPQLAEAPTIDPKTNMLRINGSYPVPPVQINFGLLFQPVAGRWRLFGISVKPAVPKTPSAASVSPTAPSDKPRAGTDVLPKFSINPP